MSKLSKVLGFFFLAAVVCLLFVPLASAADCEKCTGHPMNRYCKEVTAGESGDDDCRTNTTGQCIHQGSSCSADGGTCGDGSGGCTPETQSRIDLSLPSDGELELEPACGLPHLIITA